MSAFPETTLEFVKRLIAMPTVSRDSNMELIGFVGDYLTAHNVPFRVFEDPDEPKANLFATIGPKDVTGIILSGHSDVVPVEGQVWSGDPFAPWVADGKLFGRGAADMKTFIAAALSHVPAMLERGLKQPIHIAISYDEEVGCTGVHSLIEYVAALAKRPRLCIVGEPTSMQVVNSHKGINSFRTRITGQAAHSSAPHLGASAAYAAARFAGFIEQLAAEQAAMPESALSAEAKRFSPPYTTFNVGRMTAGTATNIIPSEAELLWEFRNLPGADTTELRARIDAFAETELTSERVRVETEVLAIAPPLAAGSQGDAETFVMQLARSNTVTAASYATEAGHFQHRAEVPTVVCGPGSIEQAHKPDEFIALAQIDAVDRFLDRLIEAVS